MGEAGRGGGAGTTGGAGGTTGSGGTGGAAGTGGSASTCPTEPGTTNATCETCTSTNCTVGPNGTDGCCLASATDQALCVALYTCFISNACTQYGDPTKCFCGTSDSQTCWAAAGAANGPCVAETTAAAKAQDLPTIRARFISPLFPIGRAVNLAACRGGLCMTECSIR